MAAPSTAINMGDTTAVMDHHTADLSLVMGDAEPVFLPNTPEFAELVDRWRGATTEWSPEGVHVQLLGDVAVATFRLVGTLTAADGTVDARPRRVTEVWVRQADGSWKEAHHHDSFFVEG